MRSSIIVVGLALALAGCRKDAEISKKKEEPAKSPTTGAPKSAAPAEAAATTEAALRQVPDDAELVMVLADWEQAYRTIGALEACVGQHPLGKRLVAQARTMSAAAPVPLPWTAAELAKLGIDVKRPLVVWGKTAPIVVLGVTDVAVFKKNLGVLWPRSTGQWSTTTTRDVTHEVLGGGAPLACRFQGARATCSTTSDALVAALQPLKQPLWARLAADEQAAASAGTVVVWGGDKGSLVARVEEDGLTLRGRIGALPPQLTRMLPAPSSTPSTLLGLGGRARSMIRLRVGLESLHGFSDEARAKLTKLGLDVDKLRASLTGELLAFEAPAQRLALVVGGRDPAVSQQVVDVLARVLARAAKGKRTGKKDEMPSVKVTKAKLAGRDAYRIEVDSKRPELPLKFTAGLAAGPLGVFIGSWDGLEDLINIERAPASELQATLSTAEEKQAFDEKGVFAMRSTLGDPLGGFAGALEKMMDKEGTPPQLKSGMELVRFLFDQMHGVTLGVSFDAQGAARVVMRLRTLHRDGNAEDDKARVAWVKGLQAKYSGDTAAYERTLQELSTTYPKTRYATLLERSKGGLLGMATVGVLAAVAIPSFVKYIRRSKAAEVNHSLARIVSAAKYSHQVQGAGGAFPKSTPWTPAKGCCASGGKCTPDPAPWEHATWKALHFAMRDPHYYQYRFVNKGKSFVAEARGDLNCDGTFSSFSIEGTLSDDGSVTLAPMNTQNPEE